MLRRALILLTILLVITTPMPAAADDPLPACPTLISHAGARELAPENTVPGINAARDVFGVDYVEGDVRYNKSNFAVLIHNDDLAPTTTGTGSITSLWLPQVQALSAADYGEWPESQYGGFKDDGAPKVRPPYSYDFLAAVKKKNLIFVADAKVTPTKVQADSLIGDYASRPELNLRAKIRWMANTPAGLTTMRGWYPELDYWLISEPAKNAVWEAPYVKGLGASTVTYIIGKITPELVAYYHAAGLAVNTWSTNSAEMDSPANWAKARDAGVDYLTTDHPDLVRSSWEGTCS